MSEDNEKNVDANSAEFNEGVEAGLNSAEDTKNWKAGNELGRELKAEVKSTGPLYGHSYDEAQTPLFLRDSSEGLKGTAQDEKDATGE
jgi:hypothetical protein